MRPATSSDRDVVVRILTASFDTNPAVNDTIIPDAYRDRRLKALMEYVFDTGLVRRGVYVTNDLQCAVIMYDPVAYPVRIGDLFRQLKLVNKSIGWSRLVYASRKDSKMSTFRPSTPHYYLQMIGTLPEAQGKGIGSMMLDNILAIAAADDKPVYLETSVPKNVEIYKKKGFTVHGDWKIREDYHVHFLNWSR